MRLTKGLLKPCYVFAPRVLLRRIGSFLSADENTRETVQLPWGVNLEINAQEGIGRELHHQNVFDIAVSEVAARILKAGDRVVDVGANIGYMTSLFAVKVGPTGVVTSFEPHPRIYDRLKRNVAEVSNNRAAARVALHECALGSQDGTGRLIEPPIFRVNEGAATVAVGNPSPALPTDSAPEYTVKIARLDTIVGDEVFALLKIDVEGLEFDVLAGARRLLSERRIENIIYEAHDCEQSAIHPLLTAYGYSVFGIGHSLFGLKMTRGTAAPLIDRAWESPSYLATSRPETVLPLLRKTGWEVLRAVH